VYVGKLIEDAENKMRESLDAIYFAKTREISDTLRNIFKSPFLVFTLFTCFDISVDVVGQAEMDRRKKMSAQIGDAMAKKAS
jgi:hypothetical protein